MSKRWTRERKKFTFTSHFSFHCWKSLRVFVSVGSCIHCITCKKRKIQFCDDDALRVGPAYDPWVGGGLVGAGCAAPPFTRWRHQLGGSRILKGAQPPPAARGCILKGTPCLNHPLPQGSRTDATTKLTPLSKLTAFFKTCFQRESKL